jgi:hypothetical protein
MEMRSRVMDIPGERRRGAAGIPGEIESRIHNVLTRSGKA